MFYLDLFRALDTEKVRYLLVGGLALNIHGVERATMDVDLMLALDTGNVEAFSRAVGTLGLRPVQPVPLEGLADPRMRRQWADEKRMVAFALQAPDASAPTLDILVEPSVDFAAAWTRRIEKSLAGTHIQLASVEDLIALKTGTGRKRDASDIEALQRLANLLRPE